MQVTSAKEKVHIPSYLSLNGKNREKLKEIGLFAEASNSFTHGFVAVDGPRSSQEFAHYLQVQGVAPNYYWIGIELLDPGADSLDEIISSAVNDAPPGAKPALIVSGLEYLVGIVGDCLPLLTWMNDMRESRLNSEQEGRLSEHPYPILFILPQYALKQIKNYARGFYATAIVATSLHRDLPRSALHTIDLPALPSGSAEDLELLDQMLLENPGPSVFQGDLLLLRGQAHFSRSEYGAAYRSFVDAFETYGILGSMLSDLSQLSPRFRRQFKGGEALALYSISRLFYAKGQPGLGVVYGELALCRYRELRNARNIVPTLSLMGRKSIEGKNEESERLHRLALREAEEEFGEGHPLLVEPLSNLAEFLQGQGRLQEAEEMQSLALRILIDEGEVAPVEVGQSLALLSLIQRDRGRWESAEDAILKAIALFRQEFGPNHIYEAGCLMELGELYKLWRKLPEAEAALSRSLAIAEEALGEGSKPASAIRLSLALLHQTYGRSRRAGLIQFIRGALPALGEALETDNPNVGRLREIFAEC